MNAVEIEEAVSSFAEAPFDQAEFPYAFLSVFGNNDVTISRLRAGANKSDIPGGLLQRDYIHILPCAPGGTGEGLDELRASRATGRHRSRFILATDGAVVRAEDLKSRQSKSFDYRKLADNFGFFLPLAGISRVDEISENPIDISATSRMNRLYTLLLESNPDWQTPERRERFNHFIVRLVFCFFAEDAGVFPDNSFTSVIEQLSDPEAANTHELIGEIFRALNTKDFERDFEGIAKWARAFPYAGGELFGGEEAIPRFNRLTLGQLLKVGRLDWQMINPDIFGSMMQAIGDAQDLGSMGRHFTSAKNILKVLDPLLLDRLRAKVEAARADPGELDAIRGQMSAIRVFDPCCSTGNYLVVAYRELRRIEARLNEYRGEKGWRTKINLDSLYGIEMRGFAADLAKLSLLIARFQSDSLHCGADLAKARFLPLDDSGNIHHGDALRADWLSICPPVSALSAPEGAGAGEGAGEKPIARTYICGNLPFLGVKGRTDAQKQVHEELFQGRARRWKSLDYSAGWFVKAADYGNETDTATAFVATRSICKGRQVSKLWPVVFDTGHEISFAHTAVQWKNLSSQGSNEVVIVGIEKDPRRPMPLFSVDADGITLTRLVKNINAYLLDGPNVIVEKRTTPQGGLCEMHTGNKLYDNDHLILNRGELRELGLSPEQTRKFIRPYCAADGLVNNISAYCLRISDEHLEEAMAIAPIAERVESVRSYRLGHNVDRIRMGAATPHRFVEIREPGTSGYAIVTASNTPEKRDYYPVSVLPSDVVVGGTLNCLSDNALWYVSLLASRMHFVWLDNFCHKRNKFISYSITFGWNTFPVPALTAGNKRDMAMCAESILLTRGGHFPASIADLYNEGEMPQDLRLAHTRNDEVVERIYVGRQCYDDNDRRERLVELYARITGQGKAA